MAVFNITTELASTTVPPTVVEIRMSNCTPVWLTTLISLLSIVSSIYGVAVAYFKYILHHSTAASFRLGLNSGHSGQMASEAASVPIQMATVVAEE